MPTKILVIKTPNFTPASPTWAGAETVESSQLAAAVKSATEGCVILGPSSLRKDPAINGLVDAGFFATCVFFQDQAQADLIAPNLEFLKDARSLGVKNCLEKGSTIFSETFFNAGKIGATLDPVCAFARKALDPARAIEAWGTLNALLFLGIRSIPAQGEKGTGERVDVQVGADAKRLVFSVRFDLEPSMLPELRRHALLELPRSACDFFELRYLADAKKIEFLAISFVASSVGKAVEAVSFHGAAATEENGSAKEYDFQTFGSMHGQGVEEKRVMKGGGFKKKFSEQAGGKKATPGEGAKQVATAEKIVDADNGNFLVSGEVLASDLKVTVSGNASLKAKGEEKVATAATAATAPEKANSLLESKIMGLEATLKQRDELVAKLNKEIEIIKDPMKMGVISNIKDGQVDGLKANLARLEGEALEAQKREKDLMSVVDKAIQMKDEAIKKFKELDTKLRQSQGGNNSKMQMLEKQLDEQKRQNKELSKRVSQLTDQITATGKRAA